MNITITCNSLEELQEIIDKLYVAPDGLEKTTTVKSVDKLKDLTKKIYIDKDEVVKAAEKIKEEEPEEEPEPDPEPEEKPKAKKAAAKKEAPELTESDIRLLATSKIKAGKKDEVRSLFKKWGGEKVSEVLESNPDSWAEFYADLEAI